MTDYQRTADEINEFLAGEDQTRDAHVAELASAYAEACKAANARLRRCGDLLRRGLRSEAIGLAQEQPDLLNVVAALDLPNLADWESVCSTYSLTKPPRLLIDVAADLNEAYAAAEPLEASLDELRLLVLARAPVAQRLLVIRRLRALDPDTPHWTEDARELEQACLAGIRQDVSAVVASGDPAAARRLADALASPDWICAPPADLIAPLARLELLGMFQDLAHAQAEGDVARVTMGIDAIRKTSARRKVPLAADQAAAVGEAEGWLAHQAALAEERADFNELCAHLEAAVLSDTPLAQLEALHARVTAYNMPVPTRIAEQYSKARRAKQIVAGRAKMWGLILAVALIAAIAVGLAIAMGAARSSSAARGWQSRIDAAIAAYDFDAGDRVWAELSASDPSLAARPTLVAAHGRIDAGRAAEATRLAQFAALVGDAEKDALPAPIRRAKLDAADALARLDTERLRTRLVRRSLPAAPSPQMPAASQVPASPVRPVSPPPVAKPAEPARAAVAFAPAPRVRFDQDVTIPSNVGQADSRVSLGPVRRGERITFRYVSGEWSNTPRRDFPPASPDAEPVRHNCVMRPRLCDAQTLPAAVATLPGNTAATPFTFTADQNIANLVLNQDDPWPNNNVGSVVYRVQIETP